MQPNILISQIYKTLRPLKVTFYFIYFWKIFFNFSGSLRLSVLNSQGFGDFFFSYVTKSLFPTVTEDLTLYPTVHIYEVVTYSNVDFIFLLSNLSCFLGEFTVNYQSHRAMEVLSLSLYVMKWNIVIFSWENSVIYYPKSNFRWTVIKLLRKLEEWQHGKYRIATFIHITVFTNYKCGNWSHIAKRRHYCSF